MLSKRTVLICCGLAVGYPYIAGYIAVSSACSVDGGTRIYERVLAEGYLDEVAYSACVGCIQDLGADRFRFVDHYVENAFINELASESGFNRYVIQPIESEACDPWRKSSRWMRDGPRFGIDEDVCVALIPIAKPLRYKYDRTQGSRLTFLGITLEIIDYDITDTDSAALLARHRMYGHTPIFNYVLERSGPFWSCNARRSFRPARFREEVLLSKEKESNH